MSKKHNRYSKPESLNAFDFASLLTYCTQAEKDQFTAGLSAHPVSSLLLNQGFFTKKQLESRFPDLRKDSHDPLLYRFDKSEDQMGKTIEHFGGGFYILDPSSAAISYYLAPLLEKDFLCLDLCAAPGGKTIAMDLRRPDGLFLANDIAYDRVLEMVKNVDRLGLPNVLSLSIDPQRLTLPAMFDLIILDAPCSGSGMIRKEPKMRQDWSVEKMNRLLPIQRALLDKAADLCKRNGLIAYSTCALSVEEDENQVQEFLHRHPNFELVSITADASLKIGLNDCGYHLIPGLYDGEGIYFAFLRRKDGKGYSPKEIKYKENTLVRNNHLISYRKTKYVVKAMLSEWTDLPFVSPGLKMLDDSEHPKCLYDHAYSKIADSLPSLSLSREEAIQFIQGNELIMKEESEDGLYVLRYENLPLGMGKKGNNHVKNYLPKGLKMIQH